MTSEFSTLFETKEQRRRAIDDLSSLREHAGWILLTRMFDFLIDDRTRKILEDEKLTQEDEKDLKIQRKDFIFVRDLPEDVLRDLIEFNERESKSDDPYD